MDGRRAASSVIIEADKPASPALAVPRIGAHHSAGILSRCHHFDTAEAPAPISAAISSRDGHSSITDRKEVVTITQSLGQPVLKSKVKVSHDLVAGFGEYAAMADRMSETEEKLAFIQRVKLARTARFDTQKPMLTILGIDQGTYKQYETRTPLPYRYLPKFCAATGVDLEWLLTGEGKGPKLPEYPPVRPAIRRRRRAA